MATTPNAGLNIISETDDMSVREFFQKLAGDGVGSNMMLIDAILKFDDVPTSGSGSLLTSNAVYAAIEKAKTDIVEALPASEEASF